ncbi:MAG: prephenate dehydratase [Alicyclobacillaceae bacterium]|nr:prephenate dehydratase [Alicyclobacillaceae bacterium]
MRVGYLGPRGTFSEDAAVQYAAAQAGNVNVEWRMFATIQDVMDALSQGTIDQGVVPIENSIEGTVRMTIDCLVEDPDLFIRGEVVLPIAQHLLALPGVRLDDVREVWSHPQALAQCRGFLRQLSVQTQACASTASAVEAVARSGRRDVAAIGPERSAREHGLVVLAADIHDNERNETRFAVVVKGPQAVTQPTKTMLLVSPSEDRAGVLATILHVLAAVGLNLTWIESRPTKRRLGTYQFFMDVQAGIDDSRMQKALAILQTLGHDVRVLGSYTTVAVNRPASR